MSSIQTPSMPPLPKFDKNFEIIETPPPLPELSEELEEEMIIDMRKDKFLNTPYDYTDEMFLEYNNYEMKNGGMRFVKHIGSAMNNWFDMLDICNHDNDITFKKDKVFIRHNNKNYDTDKDRGLKYFEKKYWWPNMMGGYSTGYGSASDMIDVIKLEF
jgi:hypothetical protein